MNSKGIYRIPCTEMRNPLYTEALGSATFVVAIATISVVSSDGTLQWKAKVDQDY